MADGGPNPLPPGLPNDSQIIWLAPIAHDGSMVLLYMVCHGSHQYTPFMLAYIPAPWILWDRVFGCLWRIRAIHRGYKPTNVRAFGAPPQQTGWSWL